MKIKLIIGLLIITGLSLKGQISEVSKVISPGYKVYPETKPSKGKPNYGVLNPRVPFVIPEQGTGALNSKAVNVQELKFTYDVSNLMDFRSKVEIDFHLRQSRYPGKRNILEIIDNKGTLALTEAQYANTRWLELSYGSEKKHLDIPFTPKWEPHHITIDKGQVLFDGKTVLKIAGRLLPVSIKVMPYALDQLVIKEDNCQFSLDWEDDYAAKVKTKYRSDNPSIKTFGFDTMVISLDSSKRDCPYILVINNTDNQEIVKIDYDINSEVNQLKKSYSQTVTLPPRSQKGMAIKLPANLPSDIYHLKIKSGTLNQYKHFMYAKRRDEVPGEMKFGIHDSADYNFGYYPDALPMRFAHKYLRWWTEGYAWLSNPDGTKGLRKEATPDRWFWNARLDAVVRQPDLIPYVNISGVPTIDFQRIREIGYMKNYGVLRMGGETDIKRYTRYLGEVMKRYHGNVRLWEVENEPNLVQHMSSRPPEYVDRLKAVYSVVKKHDPQSTVYGICGTTTWPKWMEAVFKLGGDKYMDEVSYHSYFGSADPSLLLDFLDDAKSKMPERFRNTTFMSESGKVQTQRIEVEKPLSQEYVDQQNKRKNPAFVTKAAWPGESLSEFEAAEEMVKNVTVNFLSGTKAFTFFAWTTSRPSKNINESKHPIFTVFTMSAKNERTPSRYSLALAVLTTQFEGVSLLKDDYERIHNYNVSGGIFSKAGSGKVAVIWGNQSNSSCVIETNKSQLEIVNLYGQKRVEKLSRSSNRKYRYTLNVGKEPVYIHCGGDLAVLPSPIENSKCVNTSQQGGTLTIKLFNRSSQPEKYTVSSLKNDLVTFSEDAKTVDIPAKMRDEVTFHWKLLKNTEKKSMYAPFTLQYRGGSYRVEFPVEFKVFKDILPTKFKADAFESCNISKFPQIWNIDTVEQAAVGAPPITESAQQSMYWQGPDELSGKVGLTADDKGIIVGLLVKDRHMVMPQKWPSVQGACVEFFFDFRNPGKGLGQEKYGKGVFQFLNTPKPGQDLFCPQLKSTDRNGIESYKKQLDKEHYYIGLFIPWTFAEKYGYKRGGMFGFDIAIDGADPMNGKRKTQLVLFGDRKSHKSAANFGIMKVK